MTKDIAKTHSKAFRELAAILDTLTHVERTLIEKWVEQHLIEFNVTATSFDCTSGSDAALETVKDQLGCLAILTHEEHLHGRDTTLKVVLLKPD